MSAFLLFGSLIYITALLALPAGAVLDVFDESSVLGDSLSEADLFVESLNNLFCSR